MRSLTRVLLFLPALLSAQTSPPASPCPPSSVLLTAKPIKGVGVATIKNACPAFLAALTTWYAANPGATVGQALAAIQGTTAPVQQPAPPKADPSLGTLWSDDFQSYAAVSQITAFCSRRAISGEFNAGANRDGACSNPQQIALETLPDGTKAVRYDWPARLQGTANYTVNLAPRILPLNAPNASELWIRFTDKLSSNFKIGGAGCVGSACEYKYLFVDLIYPGVGQGTLQFELDNQLSAPPNTLVQARFKIIDPLGNFTATDGLPGQAGGLDAKLPADFYGAWNTWVIGLTGIGSPQVTWVTYRNGQLVKSITGPFFPNRPLPSNAALQLELGANINNGPDQAQSRWLREILVSTVKPDLSPLVKP